MVKGLMACHYSSMVIREVTCLGCNLLRHSQEPGHTCPRGGSYKSSGAKYLSLPAGHQFVPVAVETMGTMGPRTLLFLKELGKRMRAQTGEARSADYLLQRLSAAVQRGNAISIMSRLLGGTRDIIT